MKLLKKLAIVMAAVVATAPVQLFAEELPDLKKTGSITVQMKDGDLPVAGGELSLVQVAAAVSKNDDDPAAKDRGYALKCTDQFSAEQALVDSLTADTIDESAKQIQAYAMENKIAGASAAADESGMVTFSNLATGLYLIWNSKTPAGYQTMDPFLVTIPVKNETGYSYDVDATPKMEAFSGFEPLVVSDPPVQKLIDGDKPGSVDRFLFAIKRLDSSSPLPVNDNGHVLSVDEDTLTLYADGAEKIEIGTFTFTQEGDYYYEVSEVNNGIEGYSYDTHVYWYKYEVRRDETGKKLTANRFLVKDGGAEGTIIYDDKVSDTVVFTFTNTYHKKSEADVAKPGSDQPKKPLPSTDQPKKPLPSSGQLKKSEADVAKFGSDQPKKLLPSTGQLWWPVMVLAAAGVICMVTGLLIRSRKKGI